MGNSHAPGKRAVVPFSLKSAPSLLERAWPAVKIAAETDRERNAGGGRPLTALGAFWQGRNPVILTRACVLAALMPATGNLARDIGIFEKLMGMADESLGRRYQQAPFSFARTFPDHAREVAVRQSWYWRWRDDISPGERQRRIAEVLRELPYGNGISKLRRPEELAESDLLDGVWDEVNAHLSTNAGSFAELVEQLGIMRFGRKPRFADPFSGSGSIPYEAARMGCDVYASDLNPVACLLTWGAFNIVGADPDSPGGMQAQHERVVAEIDAEICEMGVEHDASGNRAKVYLYCLEVRCPWTGYMVPLAASWVIAKGPGGRAVIAKLVPDHEDKRYDFEISTVHSKSEIKAAEQGTARRGRLYHEALEEGLILPIKRIRGDYLDKDGSKRNRICQWEQGDIRPRRGDIWQERLYAIQWMDGADLAAGKASPRTWFAAPTAEDLAREEKVTNYVDGHIRAWQLDGVVPDRKIKPGRDTHQLFHERGWTHWHHLFNPRHLLVLAKCSEKCRSNPKSFLWLAAMANGSGRTVPWYKGSIPVNRGFADRGLNSLWNYGARSFANWKNTFGATGPGSRIRSAATVRQGPAGEFCRDTDVFMTEPPYWDDVRFEEISEFSIAWLRKNPPPPFGEWIWDSRRTLAVTGDWPYFKPDLAKALTAMAGSMSENAIQIILLTRFDARTWEDMTGIFSAAGLQAVQGWPVSTRTEIPLQERRYAPETYLVVLKRRPGDRTGSVAEIKREIRDEAERQCIEMTGLNEEMVNAGRGNMYSDADLRSAGHAAALRVLTAYTNIDGLDMTRRMDMNPAFGGWTFVDDLFASALDTVSAFLDWKESDQELWPGLNGTERFYLKMMDFEMAGDANLNRFRNYARAFRLTDYDDLMASTARNNARLKTAVQLGESSMSEGTPFGRDSIVRLALHGIRRVAEDDEIEIVLGQLRGLIADYPRKRDSLHRILRHVADRRKGSDPKEAGAARSLCEAIERERV